MTRQALYHRNPLGQAALLLENDQLAAITFASNKVSPVVGSVYLGRVTSVNVTAGGAFVDIGLNAAGYLPMKRAPEGLHEGQALVVEIDRAAEGDKGVRLKYRKDEIAPAAKPPVLLQAATSPVLLALQSWQAEIVSDCGDLRARIPEIEIVRPTEFLFDEAVPEEDLELLPNRQIELPSGGNIVIEQTEALIAVDINSGTQQGTSKARGALATNLEAIDVIARQLRLRDLGGIIVIDFLRLKGKGDRQKLKQAIRDGLDDACQAGGFTATGLFDLTRQRQGSFSGHGFQAFLTVGRILAALRRLARQSHKRPLQLTLSRRMKILWADVEADIGEDLEMEIGAIELITNHKYRISDFEVETP